jgi:hypothetical protein
VIGGEGEVAAAELLLREHEIACRARERRDTVVALVDGLPPGHQPRDDVAAPSRLLACDAPREPRAAGHVDAHAEQVLGGLGQDLG